MASDHQSVATQVRPRIGSVTSLLMGGRLVACAQCRKLIRSPGAERNSCRAISVHRTLDSRVPQGR